MDSLPTLAVPATTEENAMTSDEHKQRHVELHRAFDELLADWIAQTGKLPSQHTVMDLLTWSFRQTLEPDHQEG